MKQLLPFLLLALCISACGNKSTSEDIVLNVDDHVEVQNDNLWEKERDCANLIEGIYNYDLDLIASELHQYTEDLVPVNNDNDPLGHTQNIYILIDRLNGCMDIECELLCYACVKTKPAQTEIIVRMDIEGETAKRVLDIWTPDDEELSFSNIHD